MPGGLFALGVWLLILYFIVVKDGPQLEGGVVRYRWYRLVWLFVAPVLFTIFAMRWMSAEVLGQGSRLGMVVVLMIAAVVLFPNAVARAVFRPLGWARGAYFVSLLANRTWNLAPRAGAVCAALLAALRGAGSRVESGAGAAVPSWLQRRLTPDGPLVGVHVLAEALRAQLRDEKEMTRILMETILYLPPRARGRREAVLAEQWLMLHAAERGAWGELAGLDPSTGAGRRFRRFLVAAGQALEGAEPAAPAMLTWRWLICGHPWATRRLWRSAREPSQAGMEQEGQTRQAGETRQASQVSDRPSDLEQALALSVSTSTSSPGALEKTGDAWLQALGGAELHKWLEQKSAALELDHAAARELVEASVGETMAALAEASGSSSTLPSAFSGQLGDRYEQALGRLEQSLYRLEGPASVGAHGELDRWCQVRLCWHEALLLGVSRVSLYHQVLAPLWNWASQLHGERGQRPLAQAIFAWLYQWSLEMGDEDDAQTLLENARLPV